MGRWWLPRWVNTNSASVLNFVQRLFYNRWPVHHRRTISIESFVTGRATRECIEFSTEFSSSSSRSRVQNCFLRGFFYNNRGFYLSFSTSRITFLNDKFTISLFFLIFLISPFFSPSSLLLFTLLFLLYIGIKLFTNYTLHLEFILVFDDGHRENKTSFRLRKDSFSTGILIPSFVNIFRIVPVKNCISNICRTEQYFKLMKNDW